MQKIKKLFLLLSLFVPFAAYSQEFDSWESDTVKADELKGTSEYVQHTFVNALGAFKYRDDNGMFMLVTAKGTFHTQLATKYVGCTVLVGLYDDNGLKDKVEMWLDKFPGRPDIIYTRLTEPAPGMKKKIKKVIDYIENGNGYLRFVAPRYGIDEFNMYVRCKNLELSSKVSPSD